MAEALYATFQTSVGDIVVKLLPEKAPNTVENFVDLAEGTKEWTDPKTRQQVKRPLYDGTVFHRVIPDFMIQGGDPLGTGTGGPGYRFEDEIGPDNKLRPPGPARHGQRRPQHQRLAVLHHRGADAAPRPRPHHLRRGGEGRSSWSPRSPAPATPRRSWSRSPSPAVRAAPVHRRGGRESASGRASSPSSAGPTSASRRSSTGSWASTWPSSRPARRPPAPGSWACWNGPEAQLAFFDTPGLHKAKGALNRRMVEIALRTLVRGGRGAGPGGGRHRPGRPGRGGRDDPLDHRRGEAARQAGRARREQDGPRPARALLPVIDAYRTCTPGRRWCRSPALTGENVDRLLAALARHAARRRGAALPARRAHRPGRAAARRRVRPRAGHGADARGDPYAAAVEVEEFDESERATDGGLVRIVAICRGAGVAEGHRHRQGGRHAEADRHARARGAGAAARLQGVPGAAPCKVEERWSERPEALAAGL